MGLFSDIYNTVARFFRPQEEQGEEASKSVATNRLKLVLMQDRTNLTPKILEQMRSELIDLLSRYVELDKELLELNFEQEGDQVALMLSIPVIRAKDEDEIEAAIQAHKEALLEETIDSDETDEDTEDESEDDSDEDDEIEDDGEGEEISEETEEIEASEGTEIKPKKRKKKSNVSTPDEMNSTSQENEITEQTEEEANL
ncbi:cell division topological specificity factor MinE [bacterium]|nr:cell division topological specificity factor MinE [bacterium]